MVPHSHSFSALVVVYLVTLTQGVSGVRKYCNHNTCQNGGTCLERVDGFVCDCTSKYTGLHCDILNYCNSSPCLHGGQCIDQRESYMCDCTGTGYDGFTCHVPHDDCQPNRCLHGGTCVDMFKNYTCQCILGFTGDKCEVELSACLSNPCLNGGTCFNVRAGSSPGQISPGFQCECIEGIAGDRCETNYDDCTDNQCVHGGCVDGLNSYTCDCNGTGYTGVHCDHKVTDQCALHHPCQNGATCIQDGDNYHCDCLPFKEGHITYGGKNCSVVLRGCENTNVCHNGAVCIPVFQKNVHSYTCTCPYGFNGRVCDSVTSMTLEAGSYIRKTYTSDYKLNMRFRTGNQNGVIFYDRAGQGFLSVEIVNGSLCLVTGNATGITERTEAITSAKFSDSHWHSLVLDSVNNTTLILDDPLCNRKDDCILSIQRPYGGLFREFFIGQVTVSTWLSQTLTKTGFVGCIQDVTFDTDAIVPHNVGTAELHNIKIDCPSCLTHTCEGQGQCQPSETTIFECHCATSLVNGLCSEFNGAACDFESGLCGWTIDHTSKSSWTRYRGVTPTLKTGPSGDHTTGRGYYIYTESSIHHSETMKFDSPRFNVTTATCLSLWIHMYGSTMGSLRINQRVDYTSYHLDFHSGDQGNHWIQIRVPLVLASNTYLQLEGITGSSYYSDMAVDDIKLMTGKC